MEKSFLDFYVAYKFCSSDLTWEVSLILSCFVSIDRIDDDVILLSLDRSLPICSRNKFSVLFYFGCGTVLD
jgi:hypothetical protein